MEQKRDFSTEVTAEVGPRADFFVFMNGETSGQLEQLRIVGCDQAQGFHFARPMAHPAFLAWHRERAHRHQSDA